MHVRIHLQGVLWIQVLLLKAGTGKPSPLPAATSALHLVILRRWWPAEPGTHKLTPTFQTLPFLCIFCNLIHLLLDPGITTALSWTHSYLFSSFCLSPNSSVSWHKPPPPLETKHQQAEVSLQVLKSHLILFPFKLSMNFVYQYFIRLPFFFVYKK